MYGYVGNDPLQASDPLGLCAQAQGQPCDVVVPTNEDDLAVIATLLGEASTPGEGSWGPDEYGINAYKNPTRTLTEDDVWGEMSYMISVINNRLIDWGPKKGYKSWKDTINDKEFLGYNNGQNILKNPGNNGDTNCERLRLAVRALNDFHANPFRSPFYFWKGIKQKGPKTKKWIVVRRDGAWRWANTDFTVRNKR